MLADVLRRFIAELLNPNEMSLRLPAWVTVIVSQRLPLFRTMPTFLAMP